MATALLDVQSVVKEATRWWWFFLATGSAWLLAAIIILRFDYLSVGAIAILFGTLALLAGLNEWMIIPLVSGGWKLAHGVLGALFVGLGIVAYLQPGGTFVALAAIMSFFFVFKGIFDVVASVMTRLLSPIWWLQLAVGVVELLIGFWAAGSWARSATVLVAWAGAMALTRGVTELVVAFRLRELRQAVDSVGFSGAQPTGA
jgi:uncharacterized membrane protein HdeD (DUF308 family)